MLDLQFICDHRDAVLENCRNRGVKVDVGRIVALCDERAQLIAAGDKLRHEQKESSSQIPKASADERPALIARGKELQEQIATGDERLKAVASAGCQSLPRS